MAKPRTLLFLAAALLLAAVAAYSNHFHNAFHFDDAHTIVDNLYVRDLANVPRFFTDGATFSALPANRSYRPIVSASLALDYRLGGGLGDTFWFHLSMFAVFLLQGALMVVLYRRVCSLADPAGGGALAALLAAGVYLLHPANAETINYVIARGDSYSTAFVVLALALYAGSARCRRWHLYLIPVALGVLTKPIAAIFPALLAVYLLLFGSSAGLVEGTGLARIWSICRKVAPSVVVAAGAMALVGKMTPATWISGAGSVFEYLASQPWVALRYLLAFLLPISLTADSDLAPVRSLADPRFAAGVAFVAALIAAAAVSARREKSRPIAFGLLWFVITLAPTSFTPLAELENGHRVFFPYVGLALGLAWTLELVRAHLRRRLPARAVDWAAVAFAAVVLAAAGFGTHRRNAAWRTEETLWRDVVEKSPGNGRGQMNYGLALMARGDFGGAEKRFLQALELLPMYGTLHANFGVLYEATGELAKAEERFRRGVALQPSSPDVRYLFARFLKNQRRAEEAIPHLEAALALAPGHQPGRRALLEILVETGDLERAAAIAEETLRRAPADLGAARVLDGIRRGRPRAELLALVAWAPGTPEYFLELSLAHYRQGEFRACIDAAREALRLRPGYALAYNNICSAYIELGDLDKAIEAGEKAVALDPGNERARNNLAWARRREAASGAPAAGAR
jgi:tetratricopeptide (TPR) repeat protein